MPLSFTPLFLDLEENIPAIADISIKRILATKYFLLQIQKLVLMIVVRITNY